MRIRTPRELGLAIQDRRKELGLDQAELAKQAGVSRQWVIEIEKGKPRAEVGLVLRALRVLGLQVWLGGPPASTASSAASQLDLDLVLEKARGKRS